MHCDFFFSNNEVIINYFMVIRDIIYGSRWIMK